MSFSNSVRLRFGSTKAHGAWHCPHPESKRNDQNGTPISPFGLWSDGETMLASDWQRGEIFAYTLPGGQRRPNRNIDTSESGTSYASGLWSDGRTLWVVDDLAKRVYAYTVPGLR